MSENGRTTRMRKWASRLKIFFMAFGVGFLFVLFVLASKTVFLIEAPVRFVLGWAFHLCKTVPPLLPQWDSLLLPLGCLALTALLVHRFALWWLAAKGSNKAWSFPRSLALLGLILLGSAAAIAVSGIVHQLAWLPQGKVIVNTGKVSDRSMVMSSTRQLLLAIDEFVATEGRYPADLREIEKAFGAHAPATRISTSSWLAPEPFLLIQPGSPPLRHAEGVRLISPAVEDQVIVGFEEGAAVYPARVVDEWLGNYMSSRATPSLHE